MAPGPARLIGFAWPGAVPLRDRRIHRRNHLHIAILGNFASSAAFFAVVMKRIQMRISRSHKDSVGLCSAT